MKRVVVAGCPLNLGGVEDFVAFAEKRRIHGEATGALSLNALKVVEANRDNDVLAALESVTIVGCDGVPIRWLAKLAHGQETPRLNGTDLMMALFAHADADELGVALVGSTQATLQAVTRRLATDFPGARVVAEIDGFGDLEDEEAAVERLRSSEPDIVLVALPSPWKEHFIAQHFRDVGPSISVAVGGSFEVFTGAVPRAPEWMQRSGLEWLHRLGREPKRLGVRYTTGNLAFLQIALADLFDTRIRRMP
ncbi:MAG: WecB/TagA/CpsF family glycosyltransferase [Acidimicrobiales bacterium]